MNQSAIGDSPQKGEVLLSSFFIQRDDGLYVDLEKLQGDGFRLLVERVFGADTCFLDLDYGTFSYLLYDYDSMRESRPEGGEPLQPVRLATDLMAFPPQRRALYKSVKIDNGKAEYYFEPVYLEDTETDTDAAGGEGESMLQRAVLSVDEFVADMWNKGVRYGIDVAAVRAAIDSLRSERIVVARRLEPVLGKAADIQELSEDIHRDNAPQMMSNGRLDLRQFKNRFPQIRANERLMKKIPREMGVWGREISGNPIKPPIPTDFELARLAGPGTEVEQTEEGEFIIARSDGFLSLDSQSNQISIMDKIVNREGVSARTTGDLQLSGNEYEDYGEVQEKRQIEGHNIILHADVFGHISSLGGTILLEQNLVGGSAVNQGGDITVEGVASGAILHTKQGAVLVKRAENCVIIATRVELQAALNCDILADEVSIADAQGCAIMAKSIRLEKAAPHKQSEMLVFVRTPDLALFDSRIVALNQEAADMEQACSLKTAAIEQASSQPEVRNYLLLAGKLKRNEMTLSPEQKISFNRLGANAAPVLKAIAQAHAEIGELRAKGNAIAEQIAAVEARKLEAISGIRCSIGEVAGETLVRAMKYNPDADLYAELPPKELKTRLRGSTHAGDKIFSASEGELDWHYESRPG